MCSYHTHITKDDNMALGYHKALFTTDAHTNKMCLACEIMWSYTRMQVTLDTCLVLMTLFSFENLQDAGCGLDSSFGPRDDGLP